MASMMCTSVVEHARCLPVDVHERATLVVGVYLRGASRAAFPGARRHLLKYDREMPEPDRTSLCDSPRSSSSLDTRENTPEALEWESASYFQFKGSAITFGRDKQHDVRLHAHRGISGHHFSLALSEHATWMIESRTDSKVLVDGVPLPKGHSVALNPNFDQATRIELPSTDLFIHSRWAQPLSGDRCLRVRPSESNDGDFWIVRDMPFDGGRAYRAVQKSTGAGCVAILAEDHAAFPDVQQRILHKVPATSPHLAPLFAIDEKQRIFVEPHFGTRLLEGVDETQACRILSQLAPALAVLHASNICHGTIDKDCVIISESRPDSPHLSATLTRVWRHTSRRGRPLRCDERGKAKDRKALADSVVAALAASSEVGAPQVLSESTGDPILYAVLESMRQGHDVAHCLPPTGLFDAASFARKCRVRVLREESGAMVLHSGDMAKLARQHAFRAPDTRSDDSELCRRFKDEAPPVSIGKALRLLRPHRGDFLHLMDELKNAMRRPRSTTIDFDLRFEVSYLPHLGMVNISQFQAATDYDLSGEKTCDEDLEIVGAPNRKGLYVTLARFRDLTLETPCRQRGEFSADPDGSSRKDLLRRFSPKTYVFFATGLPWTALLAVERRPPHQVAPEPLCQEPEGMIANGRFAREARHKMTLDCVKAIAGENVATPPEYLCLLPAPVHSDESGPETDVCSLSEDSDDLSFRSARRRKNQLKATDRAESIRQQVAAPPR